MHDDEPSEPPVYQKTTTSGIINAKQDLDDDGKGEGVGLKANINLFGAVMVVIGCIIGSGIFISPKGVHENAGSLGLSLIIWLLCGIFTMVGAYCYAELGTFIRKSGGDYAYVFAAFGPLIAFIRLWAECIIVRPCTMSAVALTFAIYILRPFFPHCDPPHGAPQLLAAGCLVLLTLINMMSVPKAKLVQNVFTIAKLLALTLIILTGIVLLCLGGVYVEPFENAWEGTTTSPGKIAMAFYAGLWAFNGWNYLNVVTEELENPVRNLPIAIIVSCTASTVIYVLTNIAFYAGVSERELLESPAVAVAFADRFYGVMAWIMPICVAMSCFGTVNGFLLTSSRLFYVAAREDQMPVVLSYVSPQFETPLPAVILTGLLSLFYLFLSGNIYTLMNYVQIVNWLAIGVATAGLIFLRYRMPPSKYERPIKVNLIFPIIFIGGCIFLVVFPFIVNPIDMAIGLGIMLTSVPVYYIFIAWKSKPAGVQEFIKSSTFNLQKVLLVVPTEKRD